MSDRVFKFSRFLILASGFLFVGTGLKANANELIQALQNENAALKKKAQDLQVAMAGAQQAEIAKTTRLKKVEADNNRLKGQLDAALKRADMAENRQKAADQQTRQAVATLKELKSFLKKQAAAVTAQKQEISITEMKNQALAKKRNDAEAARLKALQTASAARSEAAAAREKAIKEEADSHYNLGVILAKNRKPEAAEKQFLACLALSPDDADAHYNLGILYEGALQARTKAIHHYKRFLELKSSGADADKVAQWLREMQ